MTLPPSSLRMTKASGQNLSTSFPSQSLLSCFRVSVSLLARNEFLNLCYGAKFLPPSWRSDCIHLPFSPTLSTSLYPILISSRMDNCSSLLVWSSHLLPIHLSASSDIKMQIWSCYIYLGCSPLLYSSSYNRECNDIFITKFLKVIKTARGFGLFGLGFLCPSPQMCLEE